MVTASGAPGTAALLRALRANGEREVRLVGTDMSERSVGRHLCDAFHLVPAGSAAEFPDAMLAVAERERVDAHQLLHERPGSVARRLEEALELLPDEGGPDLLVMELAVGGERTIDGIANGNEIVLGHPKTREAMRAGLAMYFVTLEDEDLMRLSNLIVA